MTENNILEESKQAYIELLRSTKREGIENLISYLETKTDFFTAPASTRFHNNFDGGLLLHSLNVYNNFKKLLEIRPDVQVDEENIIIAALCHDLCKANYYTKEERNRKVDGRWETYEVYSSIKSPSIP